MPKVFNKKKKKQKSVLFYASNTLYDEVKIESAYKYLEDLAGLKSQLQVGDILKMKFKNSKAEDYEEEYSVKNMHVSAIYDNYILLENDKGIKTSYLWHDIWQIWKRKGVVYAA